MENFIEVVQNVILPVVTVVLGYFGWRANADKNKLKVELKGLEISNNSKEIENQSDWLDLYKKLHDDQAVRITRAMSEIEQLKKTINKFENAFKKAHSCTYYDICPMRDELSKPEANARKRAVTKHGSTGQRKRKDNKGGQAPENTSNHSPEIPDA